VVLDRRKEHAKRRKLHVADLRERAAEARLKRLYDAIESGVAESELGQNRKSSTRANVFRFAPESGHRAMQSACPKSACHVRTFGKVRRGGSCQRFPCHIMC